ncbi:MAG: LacI family DNA-binding transcriptional regulator [Chloroflexota bacterium]|nr:LacI family DNA-binding transcriptional regulator [Chloroflexota bacterium]
MAPVTINDLSNALGLSRSTVSKALNGRSDVSPATRERVLRAVDELGYQPSAAARNLRRQRTEKLGLVVNYPFQRVADFLAELIPGIAAVAEDAEYNLILYTSMAGSAERIKSLCRSREVDGIIVAWPPGSRETVALSQLMTDERMPHVFLPRRVANAGISFVAADHVQGARALTQHLISLGHRRIGFERLPEVYETDSDRHAGYAAALGDAGIAYDPSLVIAAKSTDPDYHTRSFGTFLSHPAPPTAILFFTDPMAINALSLAKEQKIRIPQDLSIAGYDGILASGVTEPALTTVGQAVSDMGRLAVESLLQLIEEGPRAAIQHTLPVELIIRGSTGPNPKG